MLCILSAFNATILSIMFSTRAIIGFALGLIVLVEQVAALPDSTSTETVVTASLSSTNNSLSKSTVTSMLYDYNTSSSKLDIAESQVTSLSVFTTQPAVRFGTSNSLSHVVSATTTSDADTSLSHVVSATKTSDADTSLSHVVSATTPDADTSLSLISATTPDADTRAVFNRLNITTSLATTNFTKPEKYNDTEFAFSKVTTAVDITDSSFLAGQTRGRSPNSGTTEVSPSRVSQQTISEFLPISLETTKLKLEDFSNETSNLRISTEMSRSTSFTMEESLLGSSSLAVTTVSSLSTNQLDSIVESSAGSVTASLLPQSNMVYLVSSTSGAVTTSSVAIVLMTTKMHGRNATTGSGDLDGSPSVAVSIGLGVIFSLIGLAAILVIIVVLRNRLKLCRHVNYRKHGSELGLSITYTAIENGNYIGPSSPQSAEKSNFATDSVNAAVDRSCKMAASSRPSNASLPDELMLLPTGFSDLSLDDMSGFHFGDSEQTTALVNENKDELDQPVLLDIDIDSFFLRFRGTEYNSAVTEPVPSSSGRDFYGALEVDSNSLNGADAASSERLYLQPSCHNHDNASGRPFHEYDPVYVPRHDAASMARRVDESSYVRTPRAQLTADPYEQVQSDQPRPRRQLPSPVTVVLPEEVGPAPVAPPRVASAARSAASTRERRALPPMGTDDSLTVDHQSHGINTEDRHVDVGTGSGAEVR